MKKIGIFLDEIKDKNIDTDQKFSKLAYNTGNMLFWHSLKTQLDLDVRSRWHIKHIDQLDLSQYKAFITTDLIWIRQMQDFSYINEIIDVLGDIPLVPISIGLQCDEFNPNFKLHPETVKVLNRISEKCVMGVRGNYTAEILKKHGITNFKVIGCPSMYMPVDGFKTVSNNYKEIRKVSMNFETFYNPLDIKRCSFLKYGMKNGFDFVEQAPARFSEKHIKDNKLFKSVKQWIDSNGNIFFDLDDWRAYMREHDFSIGARFHGNVLALWEGVPALFVTCDSRTRELCEHFALPHINIKDFDCSKTIDYYYQLADFSEFHALYNIKLNEWNEFVSMNGLDIDYIENKSSLTERKEFLIMDGLITKQISMNENENKIILNSIKIGKQSIHYDYTIIGPWSKCFRMDQEFFVEYSEDFEKKIPYSIAVIPFLGNILPISWVFNAEIDVDEIDKEYFESIDEVKRGYQLMYPNLAFRGKLVFETIVDNMISADANKTALYFSGGVDAFSSLVNIFNEKPLLLTVWGTDVYLNDLDGWKAISSNTKNVASNLGLDFMFIKTSFRNVINYPYLNENIAKPNHENWWHGFQHGIALISHSAPIAFDKGIRRVHFSSTTSVKSKTPYTCASDPSTDNNIKYSGTRTIHEGFENTRQDKIRKICRYFKEKRISLHVCWMTRDGKNCCQCEKCARTIFGIMGEGFDPSEFGFDLSDEKYQLLNDKIIKKDIPIYPVFWTDIAKGLLAHMDKSYVKYNKAVRNILKIVSDSIDFSNQFYPTEFVQHKDNIAAQNNEIMLFRSEYNGNQHKTFDAVGGNTGNMVFTKSLQTVLGLKTTSVSNAINSHYNPSHIITTDLIWITPNSNYDYLVSQMTTFKDTVFVPISVGIQASKMGDDFKLNDNTLKALNMIQERAIIGCRGYYTADVLAKHGIKNLEVIGCPSIYFKGRNGYKIKQIDELNDNISVISNFRTLYGSLSIKEKHFLSYCATRGFDFIEQTKYAFDISHTSGDEKYFSYVNKWLTKKSRVFFDIEQWYKFVAVHDFSIGARFHGNVLALWNELPALFMPIDSRTMELIDFFKLPYLPMEEFDWNKPIQYYYEMTDYADFEKAYKNNYDNFIGFLEKNGIYIVEKM